MLNGPLIRQAIRLEAFLSCVVGLNRFKTTPPLGQRYGGFQMQNHTLLYEITCGAIAIGAVLSLMWLLGFTT